MTASEWSLRARGGLKLTMRDVNALIADLAEMERSNRINLDALAESERQAIGGDGTTHWYWRDEAERLGEERAVWRETLEKCVEVLAFIEPQYQRVLDLMRKVGWKFEDSEDLDQKVAFSVYTYLVECCQKADAALSAARELLEVKHG